MSRPQLLLANEPTGDLDDANGRLVLRALAELARDGGAALLVTHDPRAGVQDTRVANMKGEVIA